MSRSGADGFAVTDHLGALEYHMDKYRIESRWPSWARWRTVTPRPHDERYPFDAKGLVFTSRPDANVAANSMSLANSGEYRVTRES